jgi:hypothetical protein
MVPVRIQLEFNSNATSDVTRYGILARTLNMVDMMESNMTIAYMGIDYRT